MKCPVTGYECITCEDECDLKLQEDTNADDPLIGHRTEWRLGTLEPISQKEEWNPAIKDGVAVLMCEVQFAAKERLLPIPPLAMRFQVEKDIWTEWKPVPQDKKLARDIYELNNRGGLPAGDYVTFNLPVYVS